MAEDDKRNRWLFTKEQLSNSPSRAHGVDATKELSYRQQTANFIQDMGRRLNVGMVNSVERPKKDSYLVLREPTTLHHFLMNVAAAFLFLACKVEEQPRKLEHVVTVAYGCLHRGEPMIETSSEEYKKLTNEVIKNELLILQTLGFDVQIRHPHPDVVKCTQLVRASKDLAQTAYFMAHNSLLLTTMCLQYRPSVVACVCIHLACQWKGIEIPHSSDNKAWWHYVDDSVTSELLNDLAHEFVEIYESCPSRFRAKIDSKQQAPSTPSSAKKTTSEDAKKSSHTTKHSTPSSKSDGSFQGHSSIKNDFAKPSVKPSSSNKHSTHSSGQKPPHKQPKPPFTPQQLAAATLSKPKPKLPAPTHEGSSSKDHSNHNQETVVNSIGTDEKVRLKQKSGDSISLEAYKQKKAKQNELLQQQHLQQQLPHLQPQHRHASKRPIPGTDEPHKSKKLKDLSSLTDAQKKEHYRRQFVKQQQHHQQAALQHLPPLPPPLPKGSSGNSPPPPPPPLR